MLGRVARRHFRRGRARSVVLLYHRLGPTTPDPQLLSVSTEHFTEHLRLFAERFVALRLADILPAAGRGVERPTVVLTFDDGYADNLRVAKPLLEQTGTPATVFVASGYVRNRQPFWWDELEQLLLRPGRLPSALALDVGGDTLDWELDDDASYSTIDARARASWTILDARDP